MLLVICAVVITALVKLFWWIVAAAVLWLAFRLARRAARWRRARDAARAHARAELVARADIQHRWYLAGDSRGTYGRWPPIRVGAAGGTSETGYACRTPSTSRRVRGQ